MKFNSLKQFYAMKSKRDCLYDIFISLRHEYVYFMCCKSASSTVSHHLQYAEYEGTNLEVQDVNDHYASPHLRLYQLPEATALEVINSPRFRKIAFVRNPFTRILSCYLHRIVEERKMNPSKMVLYAATEFSDTNKPTFAQFLGFIADQPPGEMERHWQVQCASTLYRHLNYDFIGRQESLVDDLLAVEKLLFGREMFDRAALGAVRKGPRVTSAGARMREHFDAETIGLIRQIYADDFRAFGYPIDPPGF
ncbi:sulfotransferase family protein [Novosphingobium huizhouense]|uniref:sulfotransferase family protein n=1 Tax=Novosphingobium huizhouense TaxID=2866625 RepID=UPI001CD88958|nr:sulfotransferase family protein [Novosphingobium huizhouense]